MNIFCVMVYFELSGKCKNNAREPGVPVSLQER